MSKSYGVNVDEIVGYEFPPVTFTYTPRDVNLYALGVGAPADPLDQSELKFVYELSGEGYQVLPTFGVLFPGKMIDTLLTGELPGMRYNPMMILHGEQFLELKQPLPEAATITCKPRVKAVYDKGSGALLVTATECYDEKGQLLVYNEANMFIRGIGGFGGERGSTIEVTPPDRQPDAVIREVTSEKQALLYRLNGDINPLHADPRMAAVGNFDKPILHGLCTFGYAGRAVLKAFCDNQVSRFKSINVRFVKHVFPGETLMTEMWQENEKRVIFRVKVVERDEIVLANAAVELT